MNGSVHLMEGEPPDLQEKAYKKWFNQWDKKKKKRKKKKVNILLKFLIYSTTPRNVQIC